MSDKDETNQNETNETDSATTKKKVPTWVWVVSGVLVFGLILQSCGGDTPPTEEESTSESETVVEEELEPEEPEEPEEPVVPSSFETLEELTAAVATELGEETNMGLPRELVVDFDEEDGWLNVGFVLDENFTTGLTRSGAWLDIRNIFELARKAEFVKELTVQTSFPLVNTLGEELGPQPVVTAYFDAEVFPRMNLENLPGDRFENAATSVAIHPAFQ